MPPQNGGHWGVYFTEKILSVHNEVHTIGTTDNLNNKISLPNSYFILDNARTRYLPFNQFKKVLKVAEQVKPDYIFCHHHYLFPLARKVAKRLKIPLYIRSYNIENERFKSFGKWWWKAMDVYEKYAYTHADAVFFITDDDRRYAKNHYHLPDEKITTLPFGIDFSQAPKTNPDAKAMLATTYGLNPDIPWLYFMGQLDYAPNEAAVRRILYDILPLLKEKIPAFHILICGKNLSETLQQAIQAHAEYQEILYLGFVPDIGAVIDSAVAMLNPVVSGGGVKIKVIESLAWNKTVVSAATGAIGIEQKVCGSKLITVADDDMLAFAAQVEQVLRQPAEQMPQDFYDYYYIKNIAAKLQHFFG